MLVRKYNDSDLAYMMDIWNEVVEDGIAFPQDEPLNIEKSKEFFASQTYTGVAVLDDKVVGLYILHPNNVGRCGHICNASYCVKKEYRNNHIGEALVKNCLEIAPSFGYKVLQFNAVVKTNLSARHLYEKLGFKQLGVIPSGFRLKNGEYEDICPYYHTLGE